MPKGIGLLLMSLALVGGAVYYRNQLSLPKQQAAAEQPQEVEDKPDAQDSDKIMKAEGPLAEWMDKAEKATSLRKPEPVRKPHPSDHIAPSPVGTSSEIVRKTFALTSSAKFLFEVPAHAASPQLHGIYRSFAKDSGVQSSDESADVDLLLMNDQQYADYLSGHPADTVYSVDASHDQDVNFGLPATLDRPVQYYLIFRNSSAGTGKKVVQADFHVDF